MGYTDHLFPSDTRGRLCPGSLPAAGRLLLLHCPHPVSYAYVFFSVQTSCSYTNTVQTNLGPPHMSLLYLNHLTDCFQIESHSEVLQVSKMNLKDKC